MLQAQTDIISAAQVLLIIKDQESSDSDSDRVHTRFENNSYVLVKYDQRPPTKLNSNSNIFAVHNDRAGALLGRDSALKGSKIPLSKLIELPKTI